MNKDIKGLTKDIIQEITRDFTLGSIEDVIKLIQINRNAINNFSHERLGIGFNIIIRNDKEIKSQLNGTLSNINRIHEVVKPIINEVRIAFDKRIPLIDEYVDLLDELISFYTRTGLRVRNKDIEDVKNALEESVILFKENNSTEGKEFLYANLYKLTMIERGNYEKAKIETRGKSEITKAKIEQGMISANMEDIHLFNDEVKLGIYTSNLDEWKHSFDTNKLIQVLPSLINRNGWDNGEQGKLRFKITDIFDITKEANNKKNTDAYARSIQKLENTRLVYLSKGSYAKPEEITSISILPKLKRIVGEDNRRYHEYRLEFHEDILKERSNMVIPSSMYTFANKHKLKGVQIGILFHILYVLHQYDIKQNPERFVEPIIHSIWGDGFKRKQGYKYYINKIDKILDLMVKDSYIIKGYQKQEPKGKNAVGKFISKYVFELIEDNKQKDPPKLKGLE